MTHAVPRRTPTPSPRKMQDARKSPSPSKTVQQPRRHITPPPLHHAPSLCETSDTGQGRKRTRAVNQMGALSHKVPGNPALSIRERELLYKEMVEMHVLPASDDGRSSGLGSMHSGLEGKDQFGAQAPLQLPAMGASPGQQQQSCSKPMRAREVVIRPCMHQFVSLSAFWILRFLLACGGRLSSCTAWLHVREAALCMMIGLACT